MNLSRETSLHAVEASTANQPATLQQLGDWFGLTQQLTRQFEDIPLSSVVSPRKVYDEGVRDGEVMVGSMEKEGACIVSLYGWAPQGYSFERSSETLTAYKTPDTNTTFDARIHFKPGKASGFVTPRGLMGHMRLALPRDLIATYNLLAAAVDQKDLAIPLETPAKLMALGNLGLRA